MKRCHLILAAAGLMTTGLATANEPAADARQEARPEPVELTAEQMDSVTAAGDAYGKTLITVTGYSFGQLIGPAKKAGDSAHGNYAGGVKALVEAALVGAHPLP